MSATSAAIAYPRRALRACPAPVAAFLLSRLIVLVAGAAGALASSPRDNWMTFDPAGVSERLGALGNVLGATAVRWDAIHYLSIAAHGYAHAGDTVFFPLYPLLVGAFGYLTGSTALAGVLISTAAFAAALIALHRLTKLELGARAADAAVLLLALAPLSFFFSAVYTESLFLALSVGCVYAARRERWKLAAALGALAAVTRVTGVLLVIPLAIMRVCARGARDRGLAWLLAVPASFAGYLGYVAARGFGPLAPFAHESQYRRTMSGPLRAILSALHAAASGVGSLRSTPFYRPGLSGPFSPGAESIVLLAALVLAGIALVAAFRRLPIGYGAYALAALLVCISSPVPEQPLRSVDRYTLTIFPLWMAAGAWLADRKLTAKLLALSSVALAFYAFQFATWGFVA